MFTNVLTCSSLECHGLRTASELLIKLRIANRPTSTLILLTLVTVSRREYFVRLPRPGLRYSTTLIGSKMDRSYGKASVQASNISITTVLTENWFARLRMASGKYGLFKA